AEVQTQHVQQEVEILSGTRFVESEFLAKQRDLLRPGEVAEGGQCRITGQDAKCEENEGKDEQDGDHEVDRHVQHRFFHLNSLTVFRVQKSLGFERVNCG